MEELGFRLNRPDLIVNVTNCHRWQNAASQLDIQQGEEVAKEKI